VRRQWAVPVRNGWELETESGYLSAERLSLLVTSPQERNVFKQERYQPEMSAAVSILLDCSGSMRNQLPRVLPMVEVLIRVLERAGVQTEVLGYTTASWNGGKAQKAWERAGRPTDPGRLAERLHMVLKSASQTRRAAALSIAALLKPDLYREGLDGEAVQWAAGRLLALPVTQRLVMVVSDGSPMETATQRTNSEFYLDHHLRTVLRQIERAGEVAVMGLGVGLDLSVYYRHCLGWTDTHAVQTQSIADILKVGFEAQRALRQRR
jgi:cobaltochelatase CobT